MSAKNPGPILTDSRLGGEDPIPVEFRAAMQRVQTEQTNPTDVAPEALSGTIIESRVEWDTRNELKRITVKKVAGNIVLNWTNTNDQGQPVQVTRTMYPTGTTAAVPSATQQVAVRDLGNGWSIEEKTVSGTYSGTGGAFVAGVFPGNVYSKERQQLIPAKFLPIANPVVTTRVDSAGTAAAPTLSGDELRETQEQVDPFKVRTTIETQTPTVPTSLTGYETTNERQLATVVETLETAGTSAATPTSTMDVQVQNLGNGFQVQRTSTVAAIFQQQSSGHKQMIVVPEKFRTGMTLTTTGTTSTGTTAMPTTLGSGGTGVVESNAQRIDATKVRVETTTLSGSVDTEVREYGYVEGLVAPIATTLVGEGDAASSGGYLVTNVQREVIGEGKAVNKVEAVASWPTRYGQDYNSRLDAVMPWTETTVAPGANGTNRVEVRPVDFARQRVRTYDHTSIAAAYNASVVEFSGKVVVDLPDVLTSITATYNKSSGSGASNHPVSQQFFYIVGSGSGNLSPKSTAQGSAAIIADVTVNITNFRGIQVNCQHYYFYLTSTATLAQIIAKLATIPSCGTVKDLPIFKPETKQIKVYGGQVSIQQSANTTVSCGFTTDKNNVVKTTSQAFEFGDGYSKEVGVSTKVITIPPTIHAALSVGGLTTDTETVTVTVVANSAPIVGPAPLGTIINAPTPLQATVNAGVTPTSLSATSPATIPTSGKYLVAHTGDIAEYGFTLIHAVVVDFGQYA